MVVPAMVMVALVRAVSIVLAMLMAPHEVFAKR
jgi:hypothetical protein